MMQILQSRSLQAPELVEVEELFGDGSVGESSVVRWESERSQFLISEPSRSRAYEYRARVSRPARPAQAYRGAEGEEREETEST